jgi:hypothetical protein
MKKRQQRKEDENIFFRDEGKKLRISNSLFADLR